MLKETIIDFRVTWIVPIWNFKIFRKTRNSFLFRHFHTVIYHGWDSSIQNWLMWIIAILFRFASLQVFRYTNMLVQIWRNLLQAFFEALHEVEEVLSHVLLLAHLISVAEVVNDTVQNRRGINVLLIRKHQLNHQFLHVFGHIWTLLLPLQFLQLVLQLLFFFFVTWVLTSKLLDLWSVLVNDVWINEFVRHIG